MAEWKEVAGYEGLYLVSNLGDVVALPKTVAARDGKIYHHKARPMKKHPRGKDGLMYHFVALTKDGVQKRYSVHRLVAEAFIPNPDNLPEVNHKDRNPFNNCADNLEWCSRQYNIEYSKNKAIEQMNCGSVIARFKSITDAGKRTGIGRTNINNVLKGWAKKAGGYEWRYCTEREG